MFLDIVLPGTYPCVMTLGISQSGQSLKEKDVVLVDKPEQTSSPGGKFRRGGFLILLPRELMYDELPADFNCDSANEKISLNFSVK